MDKLPIGTRIIYICEDGVSSLRNEKGIIVSHYSDRLYTINFINMKTTYYVDDDNIKIDDNYYRNKKIKNLFDV